MRHIMTQRNVWLYTVCDGRLLCVRQGSVIRFSDHVEIKPKFTRYSPKLGLMLGQRRRRWPNIKSTSGEYLVFAGKTFAKRDILDIYVCDYYHPVYTQ